MLAVVLMCVQPTQAAFDFGNLLDSIGENQIDFTQQDIDEFDFSDLEESLSDLVKGKEVTIPDPDVPSPPSEDDESPAGDLEINLPEWLDGNQDSTITLPEFPEFEEHLPKDPVDPAADPLQKDIDEWFNEEFSNQEVDLESIYNQFTGNQWDELEYNLTQGHQFDYKANIKSLWAVLNGFRMNMTSLVEFIKDQKNRRMIDDPINGLPSETYACFDYYPILNDMKACLWRGLYKHGPGTLQRFIEEVQWMIDDNDSESLRPLVWNNNLAHAAANYLRSIEGCRSIPDQIFEDTNSNNFVDELLTYKKHKRAILMPWKFFWVSVLESIFDLLTDDNYPGHPNRAALLDPEMTHIGIACNCHIRLGTICVFEIARDPVTKTIPEYPWAVDTPAGPPAPPVINGPTGPSPCTQKCLQNPPDLMAFHSCCECVCNRYEYNDSAVKCQTFNPFEPTIPSGNGNTSPNHHDPTNYMGRNLQDEHTTNTWYHGNMSLPTFRGPFDETCLDDKYWDECNEILYATVPPTAEDDGYDNMQYVAQTLYDEISRIRDDPQNYKDEVENDSFIAADELDRWDGNYDQYQWNEGLARGARHLLNEQGSCGTNGDSYGFGFRSLLSSLYLWTYKNLEYEVISSPYLVNPDDFEHSSEDAMLYILSQIHLNKNLLRHQETKQIGIGCACAGTKTRGEDDYVCIIAVADYAPVRDIKERVPVYQKALQTGERCVEKCEFLKFEPTLSKMFTTSNCEDISEFEDDSGFCKSCHELVPGCSACGRDSCTECSATLVDGSSYTYMPYTLSTGDQSCRIIGCTEVDSTDDGKCSECEDHSGAKFNVLAKLEGLCMSNCDQIDDGNYVNPTEEDDNMCRCAKGFFQKPNAECIPCPLVGCAVCEDLNTCKTCDSYQDGDDIKQMLMQPDRSHCIEPLDNCDDRPDRYRITDGRFECEHCDDGEMVWWRDSENADPLYNGECTDCESTDIFSSGSCDTCFRKQKDDDTFQYTCTACLDSKFLTWKRDDCFVEFGGCIADERDEYEVINGLYHCPECEMTLWWNTVTRTCDNCNVVNDCKLCSSYGEECLACNNGIPEADGKSCRPYIDNCNDLENNGNYGVSPSGNSYFCQDCEQGFFWDPATKNCLGCSGFININKCVDCNNKDVCTDCEYGFFVEKDGSQCRQKFDNCMIEKDDQPDRLVLGANDNLICPQCNKGFYWNAAANNCMKCAENCLNCDAEKCLTCKDDFEPNQFNCDV